VELPPPLARQEIGQVVGRHAIGAFQAPRSRLDSFAIVGASQNRSHVVDVDGGDNLAPGADDQRRAHAR